MARIAKALSESPVKSVIKLLLCLGLLSVLMPFAVYAQREKLSPEELAFVEKSWPEAKKTNTGIR